MPFQPVCRAKKSALGPRGPLARGEALLQHLHIGMFDQVEVRITDVIVHCHTLNWRVGRGGTSDHVAIHRSRLDEYLRQHRVLGLSGCFATPAPLINSASGMEAMSMAWGCLELMTHLLC